MTKYEYGIWMPTAVVTCRDCHDTEVVWSGKKKFEGKAKKHPLEERCAVTYCDYCGKDIQLDEAIAKEHNLVKRLQEQGLNAEMAQTGGMNSACEIYLGEPNEHGWHDEWVGVAYGVIETDAYNVVKMYEDGDFDEESERSFTDENELVEYLVETYGRNGQ